MKLTYKNYSEIYELPELQNLQYEMLSSLFTKPRALV